MPIVLLGKSVAYVITYMEHLPILKVAFLDNLPSYEYPICPGIGLLLSLCRDEIVHLVLHRYRKNLRETIQMAVMKLYAYMTTKVFEAVELAVNQINIVLSLVFTQEALDNKDK
ncbi:hypothetical protein AVEN_131867-1 [Araneus ventricosus]|uniref:Uncharacterized protein n=1 Tax=Araneus ventricosus TaxID=182803 RepID=A0A4Y2S700_ARAVE|nr:hypothetical protein AVEN_131867-1 [Araneus ventricosus]